VGARGVDEAGGVGGDAGVGDGGPQRPLPERFLDIDNEESACHETSIRRERTAA
jgi:hypothetical protein